MGNCFTLPTSPSLISSASNSSCSSSRSDSLGSNISCDSRAAYNMSGAAAPPPRRILPFPTPRDLGAHYQLGRELGHGQFGVIRLCTCRASGRAFACKSISKLCMQDLPDILREVRVMQRLSAATAPSASSHIVRLHQVIEDDCHVHLIMELCRGGELFDRIAKKQCYREAEAASILKHLMQSIQFCHRMGVMHRDVKPENILLLEDVDSSPIKLADFGLALEFSTGKSTFSGMAGSAYYIAPEVLDGEYSQEVDVWSTGVVLYVMLSGVPPFRGETDDDIFNAIREGNLEFTGSPWNSISFSAKDLIMRMLCVDVKARLTPAQVLEHPWILHHSKAYEGETHKSSTSTTTLNACKGDPKKEVEPSSASRALLANNEKQETRAGQLRKSPWSSTPAGIHPEKNNQFYTTLSTTSTSDKKDQSVAVMDKLIKTDNDRDDLLVALTAKLNHRRLLRPDQSSTEMSGEESDWSTSVLPNFLSHNSVGQEIRGWRRLGQCHNSISPTLHVVRPAQPILSS